MGNKIKLVLQTFSQEEKKKRSQHKYKSVVLYYLFWLVNGQGIEALI